VVLNTLPNIAFKILLKITLSLIWMDSLYLKHYLLWLYLKTSLKCMYTVKNNAKQRLMI